MRKMLEKWIIIVLVAIIGLSAVLLPAQQVNAQEIPTSLPTPTEVVKIPPGDGKLVEVEIPETPGMVGMNMDETSPVHFEILIQPGTTLADDDSGWAGHAILIPQPNNSSPRWHIGHALYRDGPNNIWVYIPVRGTGLVWYTFGPMCNNLYTSVEVDQATHLGWVDLGSYCLKPSAIMWTSRFRGDTAIDAVRLTRTIDVVDYRLWSGMATWNGQYHQAAPKQPVTPQPNLFDSSMNHLWFPRTGQGCWGIRFSPLQPITEQQQGPMCWNSSFSRVPVLMNTNQSSILQWAQYYSPVQQPFGGDIIPFEIPSPASTGGTLQVDSVGEIPETVDMLTIDVRRWNPEGLLLPIAASAPGEIVTSTIRRLFGTYFREPGLFSETFYQDLLNALEYSIETDRGLLPQAPGGLLQLPSALPLMNFDGTSAMNPVACGQTRPFTSYVPVAVSVSRRGRPKLGLVATESAGGSAWRISSIGTCLLGGLSSGWTQSSHMWIDFENHWEELPVSVQKATQQAVDNKKQRFYVGGLQLQPAPAWNISDQDLEIVTYGIVTIVVIGATVWWAPEATGAILIYIAATPHSPESTKIITYYDGGRYEVETYPGVMLGREAPSGQ